MGVSAYLFTTLPLKEIQSRLERAMDELEEQYADIIEAEELEFIAEVVPCTRGPNDYVKAGLTSVKPVDPRALRIVSECKHGVEFERSPGFDNAFYVSTLRKILGATPERFVFDSSSEPLISGTTLEQQLLAKDGLEDFDEEDEDEDDEDAEPTPPDGNAEAEEVYDTLRKLATDPIAQKRVAAALGPVASPTMQNYLALVNRDGAVTPVKAAEVLGQPAEDIENAMRAFLAATRAHNERKRT